MNIYPTPAELAALEIPTGDEPVFAEPWQAQAFAIVMVLYRHGHFTWAEWVDCLSQQIAQYPARPGENANDAYYRQWLLALETMGARKGLADGPELDERAEEWRRAYLATPHGNPVKLPPKNAGQDDLGARTRQRPRDDIDNRSTRL